MQVKVIITDDIRVISKASVDLDQWTAMPPGLRLLAKVLDMPLAHIYIQCVAAGMNVLLEEYSILMQAKQLGDLAIRLKMARA